VRRGQLQDCEARKGGFNSWLKERATLGSSGMARDSQQHEKLSSGRGSGENNSTGTCVYGIPLIGRGWGGENSGGGPDE